MTAALGSLRPPQCETGSILCKSPSKIQLSVLYAGLAMAALGVGGTRFTLGTMGANQFDNAKNQAIFFNWFFFAFYASTIISVTAIVYVQDSVSWTLGFGLTVLANLLGLAVFLLGSRFYRHVGANGSPFTGLARVVVAAIRKRKVMLSLKGEDFYQEQYYGGAEKLVPKLPTNTLK